MIKRQVNRTSEDKVGMQSIIPLTVVFVIVIFKLRRIKIMAFPILSILKAPCGESQGEVRTDKEFHLSRL